MPLDREAKRDLCKLSRQEYFELHNPHLAKLVGTDRLSLYQVHHIYPMQYAHLFPRMDVTGKANLVGLHKEVHFSITTVWNSLGEVSERMKPQHVKQMVETVNRHYSRWFHKVYDPKDAPALVSAQRAALSEVAELKAALSR